MKEIFKNVKWSTVLIPAIAVGFILPLFVEIELSNYDLGILIALSSYIIVRSIEYN